MKTTKRPCPCGGETSTDSAERFRHNTTLQHKLAVLDETGAPAHVLARARATSTVCPTCHETVTTHFHCSEASGY